MDAIDEVVARERFAKITNAQAWADAAVRLEAATRAFDAARAAMEKATDEIQTHARRVREYVSSIDRSFLCRVRQGFVHVRWEGSTDNAVELIHDYAEGA